VGATPKTRVAGLVFNERCERSHHRIAWSAREGLSPASTPVILQQKRPASDTRETGRTAPLACRASPSGCTVGPCKRTKTQPSSLERPTSYARTSCGISGVLGRRGRCCCRRCRAH